MEKVFLTEVAVRKLDDVFCLDWPLYSKEAGKLLLFVVKLLGYQKAGSLVEVPKDIAKKHIHFIKSLAKKVSWLDFRIRGERFYFMLRTSVSNSNKEKSYVVILPLAEIGSVSLRDILKNLYLYSINQNSNVLAFYQTYFPKTFNIISRRKPSFFRHILIDFSKSNGGSGSKRGGRRERGGDVLRDRFIVMRYRPNFMSEEVFFSKKTRINKYLFCDFERIYRWFRRNELLLVEEAKDFDRDSFLRFIFTCLVIAAKGNPVKIDGFGPVEAKIFMVLGHEVINYRFTKSFQVVKTGYVLEKSPIIFCEESKKLIELLNQGRFLELLMLPFIGGRVSKEDWLDYYGHEDLFREVIQTFGQAKNREKEVVNG